MQYASRHTSENSTQISNYNWTESFNELNLFLRSTFPSHIKTAWAWLQNENKDHNHNGGDDDSRRKVNGLLNRKSSVFRFYFTTITFLQWAIIW